MKLIGDGEPTADVPPDDGLVDHGSEVHGALRALASLLVEEETLESTLARIARLTVDVISACDEGTLSAVENGALTARFSTGETSQTIDDRQFASGVGPCLDAMANRHPIRVGNITHEDRWPEFVSLATDNGVTSILSIPLEVGDEAVGILNLYSMGRRFQGRDEGLGRAFAREAAVAVANARAMERSRSLVANLELALVTRDLIGRAVGVTMVQQGTDAHTAFEWLREMSQRENRKLRDVAQQVVEAASSNADEFDLPPREPTWYDRPRLDSQP